MFRGKEYYVVDSADPTEDTGNEVCAKAGKTCVGYTEATEAVCTQFHTDARVLSGTSGDKSGVYCDGPPQSGECSLRSNTCLVCPRCTNTVDCSTPIGGLYREMYVECISGVECPGEISATNTNAFLSEIPRFNSRIQSCPLTLPDVPGLGFLISDGNAVLDIKMKSGAKESVTVKVKNKAVTGIEKGSSACVQKISISESDLDSIFSSGDIDIITAVTSAYKGNKLKVSGCTLKTRFLTFLFVGNPLSRWILPKLLPQPAPKPKPKPKPTLPPLKCAKLNESCDDAACTTGICAAPRGQTYGYICIDQSRFQSLCVGQGNAPPAWNCIVHTPCGTPTAPPPASPTPAGYASLGQNCDNRPCTTGICGAPRGQSYGYICIDKASYQALCVGQGNVPPAWNCIITS